MQNGQIKGRGEGRFARGGSQGKPGQPVVATANKLDEYDRATVC